MLPNLTMITGGLWRGSVLVIGWHVRGHLWAAVRWGHRHNEALAPQ